MRVGDIMKIGSIVKWKYSKDKLFIVVSVEDTQNIYRSVGVVGVKSGKVYNMFVSDLEVVCK